MDTQETKGSLKTLREILNQLQKGEKPEYRELVGATMVLSNLLILANMAFERIEHANNILDISGYLKTKATESLRLKNEALDTPPRQFLIRTQN